jgi:hypothetical protein
MQTHAHTYLYIYTYRYILYIYLSVCLSIYLSICRANPGKNQVPSSAKVWQVPIVDDQMSQGDGLRE